MRSLSIEHDATKFPEYTHLLAVVGEPVSGKTLFAQELFQYIFKMRQDRSRWTDSEKLDLQIVSSLTLSIKSLTIFSFFSNSQPL